MKVKIYQNCSPWTSDGKVYKELRSKPSVVSPFEAVGTVVTTVLKVFVSTPSPLRFIRRERPWIFKRQIQGLTLRWGRVLSKVEEPKFRVIRRDGPTSFFFSSKRSHVSHVSFSSSHTDSSKGVPLTVSFGIGTWDPEVHFVWTFRFKLKSIRINATGIVLIWVGCKYSVV